MVRASTKSHDESQNEFYMMIGYCIAAWAGVDDELFRIFQHCTRAEQKQAAIVYYRMPDLSVRLGLVDEIVRSVLPQTQSGQHDHPNLTGGKPLTRNAETSSERADELLISPSERRRR